MKYSVEMYVPKNKENYSLMIDKLKTYNKYEFVSITDGIKQSNTNDFINFLSHNDIDLSKICLHVSYMNRGKESVHDLLDFVIRKTGIKNVFLIRGGQWLNKDYESIIEVINDINIRYNKYFTLHSSFYPDGYCYYSLEKSAEYAMLKIAHGCDYLISQYTTDYSNLERFKLLLDRFDLGRCLIPSVMPLLDDKAVNIVKSITGKSDDVKFVSEENSINNLKANVEALSKLGFNHVHIFTLNHVKFLSELAYL